MRDVCDLCRLPTLEPAYRPADTECGITVHLCTHCGLVQSLPRAGGPARSPAAPSGEADWGNLRDRKSFRAEACINLIRGHADLAKPLSVLDTGSSRGTFARLFLTAAPRSSLACVESNACAASSVAAFDIVHSCDSIEHPASPAHVLESHWRALKPGGLLVVDARNIALIASGDILEEWFVDQRLFHFSRSTLARAIEAAGFAIVDGPDDTDRENLLFAARKCEPPSRSVGADAREVERAEFLISSYTANRARNLAVLTHAAAELARLAPKGIALWGAGRLFDALVVHGRFNPNLLSALIDTHLKDRVPECHGVALSGPEALAQKKPGVIVVMSGAFAREIETAARTHAPDAEILRYGDLIRRAPKHAA